MGGGGGGGSKKARGCFFPRGEGGVNLGAALKKNDNKGTLKGENKTILRGKSINNADLYQAQKKKETVFGKSRKKKTGAKCRNHS